MKPFTVDVRRYGTVAVVTLCPDDRPADPARPASLILLRAALALLPDETRTVVVDLDAGPYPVSGTVLAAIDVWGELCDVTVISFGPAGLPPYHRTAHAVTGRLPEDRAGALRAVRTALGVRALLGTAEGIRRARAGEPPCA
ncbi:hypothetical protein [Streptomyces sp. CC208A]|uniref:hypothetical protein n=1 Tax=Streptomyces sp. CC208A TaxID=3044573 RepID=UPI0024A870AB|nr:hypothetical protein [Streptomyces sp. CC208A]